MKNLFSGICTAFSMYSILPMPQLEWNKRTMRYAMCFFPLVGVVIAGAAWLANQVLFRNSISAVLYGAVFLLLPLVLSGGIHLDGLIDTADARHSHQERKRKLEILKDPHVGAFGVIVCAGYLVLQFGLLGQLKQTGGSMLVFYLSFVLSRCMSALSVVTFPTAKDTGLAHLFADQADRRTVRNTMYVAILLLWGLLLWNHWLVGAVAIVVSVLWFFWYRRICLNEFGGITGDLAGYFLQIQELLLLAVAVLGAWMR